MEEAVVQYRAALALDPAGAEAHNNLGAALATAGRFDEAAEEISEALRISSTFSDPHRNLGLVRMKQGRDDEAIREFTDALRSAPMLADGPTGSPAAVCSTATWSCYRWSWIRNPWD
jgi:protein O-GlcNAc transferase